MHVFEIAELKDGALLPLDELLKRIDFIPVARWRFREVTMHSGQPFGMTIAEFERATSDNDGFTVESKRVSSELGRDFQMIDGEIDALADSSDVIFSIACLDSTLWEIRVADSNIAQELTHRGAKPKK
jgi:hypothetical protein